MYRTIVRPSFTALVEVRWARQNHLLPTVKGRKRGRVFAKRKEEEGFCGPLANKYKCYRKIFYITKKRYSNVFLTTCWFLTTKGCKYLMRNPCTVLYVRYVYTVSLVVLCTTWMQRVYKYTMCGNGRHQSVKTDKLLNVHNGRGYARLWTTSQGGYFSLS